MMHCVPHVCGPDMSACHVITLVNNFKSHIAPAILRCCSFGGHSARRRICTALLLTPQPKQNEHLTQIQVRKAARTVRDAIPSVVSITQAHRSSRQGVLLFDRLGHFFHEKHRAHKLARCRQREDIQTFGLQEAFLFGSVLSSYSLKVALSKRPLPCVYYVFLLAYFSQTLDLGNFDQNVGKDI